MKTKLITVLNAFFLIAVSLLLSCNGDPDPLPPVGAEGFYIVNEGAFNGNNASLSFYDRATDQVTNDVFQTKNGRPLGDQAQSMTVFEGKGYIVVQNSGKVEVIDISDNSSIMTITDGIESPRYFAGITATKGYLSDWGADGLSGSVKVIDLTTYEVTKTIATGQGPNKMLLVGNRVFVPQSGGFGKDNTVKVIDVETDVVIASIAVADNPNSVQLDRDGILWVASGGHLVYNEDFSINEQMSTTGMITKVGPDLMPQSVLAFGTFTYNTLANLEINPDHNTLYYTFDGNAYAISILANVPPTVPFIAKSAYGLAVDPFTADVIVGLAPTFSSAGKIEIYDADGSFKKEYTAGIGPNGCAFK